MALTDEEKRQVGKGFGGPRPQPQASSATGQTRFADQSAHTGAAQQVAQGVGQSAEDQRRLALLRGGLSAIQNKALELQGQQMVIDAAQRFYQTGVLPEDPTLKAIVQQYLELDRAGSALGGGSNFFDLDGDCLTLTPIQPATEADFSAAMQVLAQPQGRALIGGQQKALRGN